MVRVLSSSLYVVGSVLCASVGAWWLGRVFVDLLREVEYLFGHVCVCVVVAVNVILLNNGIFFQVGCFCKVRRWLCDV